MLQRADAEDFVVGTGQTHSIREFCALTFDRLGLNYRDYVVIDPKYIRPAEVNLLQADPQITTDVLGWTAKQTLKELINDMVSYEWML